MDAEPLEAKGPQGEETGGNKESGYRSHTFQGPAEGEDKESG